ncbi:hypothetical protein ACSXEW_15875 (plasmid) [Clostridium perfringens]
MKNNEDMLAIRITYDDDNRSANEIMNIYLNNALENEGETWYSTDVVIGKYRNPGKAIFFNNTKNSEFYYIADISEIRKFKNDQTIIEGAIPEVYKDDPKKTWILISNIKQIERDYLKKYKARIDDESLFDKLTQNKKKQKFTRIYFYKE